MTIRRLLAAGALALVAGAGLPAPAQAATYRYWSYWIGDSGDWTFSNIGPASRVPDDGAVEGWRFSEAGLAGGNPPTAAPTFADICAGVEPPADGKRVAVIVDPGSEAEAPEGEAPPGAWAMCVVADTSATGYAVLRSAAEVRVDRGLVCGIGGYPASECAVVVGDDDATPSPRPSKEPSPEKTKEPRETATPTVDVTTEAADPSRSPKPTPTNAATSASASPRPTTPAPSTSPAAPQSPTLAAPSPTVSLMAAPMPSSGDGGGGSAAITIMAILAVLALGAAAVLRSRRRRT